MIELELIDKINKDLKEYQNLLYEYDALCHDGNLFKKEKLNEAEKVAVDDVLKDLKNANEKLRVDIEHIKSVTFSRKFSESEIEILNERLKVTLKRYADINEEFHLLEKEGLVTEGLKNDHKAFLANLVTLNNVIIAYNEMNREGSLLLTLMQASIIASEIHSKRVSDLLKEVEV